MRNKRNNIAECVHPLDIASMKFGPISLVQVKHSLISRYKSFLRSNRRAFNFENLSTYSEYVSNCYQDQEE